MNGFSFFLQRSPVPNDADDGGNHAAADQRVGRETVPTVHEKTDADTARRDADRHGPEVGRESLIWA
jgi:hypothetical protein